MESARDKLLNRNIDTKSVDTTTKGTLIEKLKMSDIMRPRLKMEKESALPYITFNFYVWLSAVIDCLCAFFFYSPFVLYVCPHENVTCITVCVFIWQNEVIKTLYLQSLKGLQSNSQHINKHIHNEN